MWIYEIITSVFPTHPPLIYVLISYVKEIMFWNHPTHLLRRCHKIRRVFLKASVRDKTLKQTNNEFCSVVLILIHDIMYFFGTYSLLFPLTVLESMIWLVGDIYLLHSVDVLSFTNTFHEIVLFTNEAWDELRKGTVWLD